jgi:ribulose-phosphate 3-epimerase
MMTDPGDYLEAFKKAGADGCTVHVEVDRTDELITQMRDLGLDVGLAANPETPFGAVEPYLGDIDLLLLMTVHPGFGGQSFIADVVPKIEAATTAIETNGYRAVIQVDGGIDEDTAPIVARAGASVFVAGSAIFGADDPEAAARRIREAAAAAAA